MGFLRFLGLPCPVCTKCFLGSIRTLISNSLLCVRKMLLSKKKRKLKLQQSTQRKISLRIYRKSRVNMDHARAKKFQNPAPNTMNCMSTRKVN